MTPSIRSKPKPRPDGRLCLTFEALGTHWQIDVSSLPDGLDGEDLRHRVAGRLECFDRAYSRFRDDSLVMRVARRPGSYRLPDDAAPLMSLYRELYDLSGGAVTPLIGRLLSDAGYDAVYSLRPGRLQVVPAWDDVMDYQHPELRTRLPVLLDLGACGKGYAVDLVAGLLSDAGCRGVCVDAGGDMVWLPGSPAAEPLRVGLEDPDDPARVVGVAGLAGGALCGSAGNRRAWGRYHHILDPRTLDSPRHIQGLWVAADSALLADGLATALFFVSPDVLRERYTFEYAILYDASRLERSPGFPATFFTVGSDGV